MFLFQTFNNSKILKGIFLSLFFFLPSSLFAEVQEQVLQNINPQEAYQIILENKSNSDFQILDVRTLREYQAGHLKDSTLINFYDADFSEKLNQLDKNKTYLIYCRSGNRSGRTLSLAKRLGFKKVYNMLQGMNGWSREGLPVE